MHGRSRPLQNQCSVEQSLELEHVSRPAFYVYEPRLHMLLSLLV
jgi:hypothetical protein